MSHVSNAFNQAVIKYNSSQTFIVICMLELKTAFVDGTVDSSHAMIPGSVPEPMQSVFNAVLLEDPAITGIPVNLVPCAQRFLEILRFF